jgi:hypothetical protein
LKPGQTYFPGSKFSAFSWGLPFGWLGGGTAQLLVFTTRETFAAWPGNGEVLFHRQRMLVYTTASNPAAASVVPNWPLAFPWPNAKSGVNSSSSPGQQSGLPIIGIVPSKVIARARVETLGAANTIRFLFLQTDDFDLQPSAGTYPAFTGTPDNPAFDAGTVSGTEIEAAFPTVANSGFKIAGSTQKEFPEIVMDDKFLRLGGDKAICIPIDMTGGIGTVGGAAVLDVSRYGFVG